MRASSSTENHRIAFYQGVFRPHFDGTMTTMTRVVAALKSRGISHLVLTPIPPTPEDNCSTPVVPVRSVAFPPYPRYRVALPSRRAVWQALDRFAPDLVQIGTPDLGGKCVLSWARSRGVPAVGGYHTHFPTYLRYYRLGALEPLLWKDFRAVYNACALTLVPTRAIGEDLRAHGIRRLALWPRGVDTNRFSPDRRCENVRRRFAAPPVPCSLLMLGALLRRRMSNPSPRLSGAWAAAFPAPAFFSSAMVPSRPACAAFSPTPASRAT